MKDLTAKHYVSIEQMDSNEHRLMILDHEFALDSTADKTYSDQRLEKEIHRNHRLKGEFVQNLRSMVSYKPCKRCAKQYLPIQNSGSSCKYHPGNKKYFSCKNCGKDAYYTCCNWCDECIEGCTVTFHV